MRKQHLSKRLYKTLEKPVQVFTIEFIDIDNENFSNLRKTTQIKIHLKHCHLATKKILGQNILRA